jgi:hypothetical protein
MTRLANGRWLPEPPDGRIEATPGDLARWQRLDLGGDATVTVTGDALHACEQHRADMRSRRGHHAAYPVGRLHSMTAAAARTCAAPESYFPNFSPTLGQSSIDGMTAYGVLCNVPCSRTCASGPGVETMVETPCCKTATSQASGGRAEWRLPGLCGRYHVPASGKRRLTVRWAQPRSKAGDGAGVHSLSRLGK